MPAFKSTVTIIQLYFNIHNYIYNNYPFALSYIIPKPIANIVIHIMFITTTTQHQIQQITSNSLFSSETYRAIFSLQ